MSENNAQEQGFDTKPGEVRFNTGCLAFIILLLFVAVLMLGFAAFDRELFEDFADTRTRGNILRFLRPFEFGGVNIALLGLVGYLGFVITRYVRRVRDNRAIRLDGDIIRFHKSLREDQIALADLYSIKQDAKGVKSDLILQARGGKTVRISMIDAIDAEAFVGFVEDARAEHLQSE